MKLTALNHQQKQASNFRTDISVNTQRNV